MSTVNEKVNWKEYHREQKERRKKWKHENVIKKLEKKLEEEKQQTVTDDEKGSQHNVTNEDKKVSTISLAVPGSILDNAQSNELRTYLAGQIARAACIFKVDEVIVFDDYGNVGPKNSKISRLETDDQTQVVSKCCIQLARILQYLECPQYLRKFFFPLHKDLKFSGLLNPLDAPHHLRSYNDFEFREGVITNKAAKDNKGSFVNVGLLNDCFVDKPLAPGLRVTVKLHPNQDLKSRKIRGSVVPPSQPRQETGVYWGYNVRIAQSLSHIFSQSPYPDGYDLTIGTSDKGNSVHSVENSSLEYDHLLIVFGGLQGIDGALENDDKINVDDASLLFDQYLNIVPGQGSRTIRTEEAILIALSSLEEKLKPKVIAKPFDLSKAIPQSEETGVKQHEIYIKRKQIIVENYKHSNDQQAGGEGSSSAEPDEDGPDNKHSKNDLDLSKFD